MKQTLKITILMVLMTIVTLTLASCDELLNKLPFGNETTPQELITIGCTTTPEPVVTTPEPDVTTPAPVVTTPEPDVTTTEPEDPTPEAHVHTVVVDKAIAPTSTEDGFTGGKHCSSCGEVLVPQEKLPAYGENAFFYKVNEDGKTCTIMGIGNYPGDIICIDNYIDGYEVVAIGSKAFSGCYTITSIQIPDSVASIGAWAFSGCSSLKSITFGSGIASIGEAAFFQCYDLEDVYVTDLEAWLNIVFILPDNYELMQSESHGTHQPNGNNNVGGHP